jgi:hypothetical protein
VRGPTRHLLATPATVLGLLALCACDGTLTGTIADDTRKVAVVDAGSLRDVVREVLMECREELIDAGRIPGAGTEAGLDVCSVAWFYEGCPLRVCAEKLVERVAPQCPPRDSGVETADSRFCETVVWPLVPQEPP